MEHHAPTAADRNHRDGDARVSRQQQPETETWSGESRLGRAAAEGAAGPPSRGITAGFVRLVPGGRRRRERRWKFGSPATARQRVPIVEVGRRAPAAKPPTAPPRCHLTSPAMTKETGRREPEASIPSKASSLG